MTEPNAVVSSPHGLASLLSLTNTTPALTLFGILTAAAAASCIGTFLMGTGGNLPLGIAPGMGLNAYFAVGD